MIQFRTTSLVGEGLSPSTSFCSYSTPSSTIVLGILSQTAPPASSLWRAFFPRDGCSSKWLSPIERSSLYLHQLFPFYFYLYLEALLFYPSRKIWPAEIKRQFLCFRFVWIADDAGGVWLQAVYWFFLPVGVLRPFPCSGLYVLFGFVAPDVEYVSAFVLPK